MLPECGWGERKMTDAKYPNVEVRLSGEDGNAFMIIGRCRRAAKAAGVSNDELEKFSSEAMSGDYDNVLQTCMKWFTVQ
jgi:hypothetical protein